MGRIFWVSLAVLLIIVSLGLLSNLVTARKYHRQAIREGAIDAKTRLTLSLTSFPNDDQQSIYPHESFEAVVWVPFFVRIRKDFSEGPNLGETIEWGDINFFGFKHTMYIDN